MVWLNQDLQLWERQRTVGAATREDDNDEYHSDTGSLIATSINLSAIQEFNDAESVASDNLEIEKSYKPVTKLLKKKNKPKEKVADDIGLDLISDFRKNLEAK